MTCYPRTNLHQEVIFFANLMYLSSHLERKNNACPTFLPVIQVHFYHDMWYLSSVQASISQSCDRLLFASRNHSLCFSVATYCLVGFILTAIPIFFVVVSTSFLFLAEKVKEYNISDEIVWGYKFSHSAIIVLPVVLTECFWIYAQQWAMTFYFRSLWEEMFTVKKEKFSRCWALGTVVK